MSKKPSPAEVAAECLEGDVLESLLDFTEFLKVIKVSPRWISGRFMSPHTSVTDSWSPRYKGHNICNLRINFEKKFWTLSPSGLFIHHEEYITDDGLKAFILGNISGLRCKGKVCPGKEGMTIFDKRYGELCCCCPIRLKNPKGMDLEYLKQIILITKIILCDKENAAGVT